MKTIHHVLISSALAASLAACGTAANTTGATATKTGVTAATANDADAAKLTDAAAESATTDATATAQENDAAGDEAAVAAGEQLPSYLDVVKQARDYTRKLLGIDDSALKTFKAEVQTARALANSPEEFKANIASAEDEFRAAMDAQTAASEAARLTDKEALDAIYAGTVKVFLACGSDVAIGQHGERGDDHGPGRPGDGEKGPKKGGKHPPARGDRGARPDGGEPGQDDRDDQQVSSSEGSSGPRMMFGNGEFNGNSSAFLQHFGKNKMGLVDAAVSTECTAAVAGLQVLVTPVVAASEEGSASGSGS